MHSSQQYLVMYATTDSFSDRCDRENEQLAINGSTARSRVDSIIVDSVTEKRDEIRILPPLCKTPVYARHMRARARALQRFARDSFGVWENARCVSRGCVWVYCLVIVCAAIRTYKDGNTQGSRA